MLQRACYFCLLLFLLLPDNGSHQCTHLKELGSLANTDGCFIRSGSPAPPFTSISHTIILQPHQLHKQNTITEDHVELSNLYIKDMSKFTFTDDFFSARHVVNDTCTITIPLHPDFIPSKASYVPLQMDTIVLAFDSDICPSMPDILQVLKHAPLGFDHITHLYTEIKTLVSLSDKEGDERFLSLAPASFHKARAQLCFALHLGSALFGCDITGVSAHEEDASFLFLVAVADIYS